jgi:GT2 family glycosyltransferase
MSRQARTAALVLARDRPEPTRATLTALAAQEPDVLVLVDNDATPDVSALLAAAAAGHSDAELVRLPTNRGCAGGFQAGLERVLARDDIDLVCGFDDDATPQPGCLAALRHAALSLPDVGVVAAVAHDADGVLAWPMYADGAPPPLHTVTEVRTEADARGGALPVANTGWQGLMLPVEVLRRHGNVWGELFLQYEDIELGMRLRRAGLLWYLIPDAVCRHPAPPPARHVSILGRQIDVTRQSATKEYLTLRNGLVVRSRYDGARFWYGTGPFLLLRGFLSAWTLGVGRSRALRHVFLQGVLDAVRHRLGPPPTATAALAPRARSGRRGRSAGS